VVAGSLIAPRLAKRFRPEFVLGFGMLIAAGGLLLFTQIDNGNGVVLVVLGLSVAAFGMGPQGVLCTEMVVGSVPARKAGAASAMSETSGEFGIAMGIAVFGSIGTAVYRDALPADAPAQTRESLASALGTGDQALLEAARGAFTSGVHTVAAVAAVIVIVFAVVGMVALRTKSRPAAEAVAEEPALAAH
jgi:DHA2 family multidrug resistance protein-like MFS transporter